MRHSLVLVDRGANHRHRWLPTCTCGTWQAIPIRSRARAETMYRKHVQSAEKSSETTRRRTARWGGPKARLHRVAAPGPRPLTPVDELPDVLR